MADPQHVEELDGFDRTTVRFYRTGLGVAAAGLLALGIALLADAPAATGWAWWAITAGCALAVADMHLYARDIRWVIGALAWTGAALQLLAPQLPEGASFLVAHAGLGFVFAALSAFALKEQFCFRIPGLRLVPVMLAASLIPMLGGVPVAAGALLALAGTIYLVLAVAKWRMPLHFDIGDKSRYQI